MPRTNTSGVSNAGPVEEGHVSLADGTLKEVNDMPAAEEKGVASFPGSSSSPSPRSNASTSKSKPRNAR